MWHLPKGLAAECALGVWGAPPPAEPAQGLPLEPESFSACLEGF